MFEGSFLRDLGRRGGAALRATALGLGVIAAAASAAEAREFVGSQITLDLETGEFEASYTYKGETAPLNSPRDIADGLFTRLDLKVALKNQAVADKLRRQVDESYTDEPSGCAGGVYAPLAMEGGLRYFFEVNVPSPDDAAKREQVSAVVFPGDRTDHFANDVFCEYSEDLGEEGAVFHLVGFFYVIHRKTQAGWDVQLRAVQLTPAEIEAIFQ